MIIKRTILFCAATLAALILTVPAQAATPPVEKYPKNHTWAAEKLRHYPNGSGRPKWMPPIWFAIAACEQPSGKYGTQWNASSSGYVTGFGFARSTWNQFKLPGYPSDATKASTWQMYKVALRVYHSEYKPGHIRGFSGWGCYTGGGYKYHL